MRSLTFRFLLFVSVLLLSTGAFAHDVTITGTQNFSSLDGSSSDHDGAVNGVFTVSDGNLAINGVVNCNDDTTTSACAMTFAVSGNMSVGSTGALFAENRSGGGTGGAITLNVGGNLSLSTGALISTDSKSSSGATGGNITANVAGAINVASGATIDAGSSNAAAGQIKLAAGGTVGVDGNVLSGPSRTLLATRLTAAALDGGSSNQAGGAITISSTSFVEPSVVIGSSASIVSQGRSNGAGPVTVTGCGIQVRGLTAALSEGSSAARVSIRSGKSLLVDARDLGVTGATLGRNGRVRADAPSGTSINKGVDLFAAEGVQILGPAAANSALYAVSSLPGLHDSKSFGGLIRILSTGATVTGSGNVIDNGRENAGDTGGTIQIAAKADVNLATAVIRAIGDINTNNPNRGGGSISVRSYSGNVIWTNGVGEVRPTGSNSSLATADQGVINLTACGTVNVTGTSFPVMGVATFVFPNIQTGVCSPAAPALPAGVPPFVVCNTPPVANDVTASTNEDHSVTITLSGSDVDGDPLTFSIVSGPSNGSLGAIVPVNSTSATVVYTPNANYNGTDSFVYQANDGNGGTDNATVTIAVAAVNDAPSFLAGPSVTSLEDGGAQSVANWATGISAGPADESGQTVTFTVTNDNPSLFSVQPAVASNGTLTYTAAANAHGTANITIVAQDNGGTANGGVDTSAPQTSSITITAVNDAPSFTAGGDVTVGEDSGAYSAAWATGISAGPNEGSQSVSFNVSNSNNALFAVQPAISATGVLSFTPAANASGTATVTVSLSDDGGTANGGADTSAPVTFTITVNAVNDAPSFTGGGNVTVNEDSGAYSAAWAMAISAGPADESGQSLTFAVTNDNDGLFSVQPSVAPNGSLSFTLAADASGVANVTVTLSDDGGTANGGVDTSAPQTFTITVNAVNDAPSFTAGGNVTVNEDSGAYSAAWATGISAGPNEAGQAVSFNVSNSNNALFSAQPAISPSGVLTFTPAANAFGTATVTVSLTDDGGTANGGVDTSALVTFTITIDGVNDAPTAANDTWETEGNTELRVDLAAGLTANVADTTPSGTGVLDNDADTIEGDSFSITSIVGCADVVAPFDCTFGDGSKLSMQANGSFSWIPGAGATSGSFQYVVTDNPAAGAPASATGTVNIIVHDEIWYVKGGAVGGNGTSVAPFGDFTSLDGGADVDNAGAYIFVHTSTVAGSIALEANQHLLGEGVGLIINRNLNGNGSPATLVAPGVQPTVTSTGDTVSVDNVTGTEIAGLRLASATGNAIDVTSNPLGANAAGASIHDNVVANAGAEGIDVNGGGTGGTTVSVTNTPITSTGNGFNVTSLNATVVAVSYSNGTITSTGGHGISIDGSAGGNLFVTGLSNVTVSGNTAGDGIRVQTASFDAIPGGAFDTVSAGVTVGSAGNGVGGNGVLLDGISGDVAFSSLTAYADNGAAVSFNGTGLYTGAAGFRVNGGSSSGIAVAANGPAVRVVNATIGVSHLTFGSVMAAGAVNGIVLNNTGTMGGLKVVGIGTPGSGGSILNATGSAVLATNTASLGLAEMTISNPASHGIDATNLGGSSTITNTTITQFNASTGNGVLLVNTDTNGSLLISGSTFSNAPTGNDALSVEARGTSNMDVTVNNASRFTGLSGDGIDVRTIVGASGTINLAVRDSQFDTAAVNGNGGIVVNAFGGPATVNMTIERNLFDDTTRLSTNAGVVNITAGDPDGSGPSVFGVIRQNTFTRGNGRRAINAIADTFATLLDLRVDDNNIDRMTKGAIFIDSRNVANTNSRVTNNRIGQMAGFVGVVGASEEVVRLQTQNTASMASLVEGNVISANTPFEVLRVRATNTSNHTSTVRGNSITDGVGAHVEISFQTASAVGVGPALCANVNGNTLPAAGVGVIQLNEGAGALNVVQASTAAVSTANSNTSVTVVGTPQFGVPPCGLPPV